MNLIKPTLTFSFFTLVSKISGFLRDILLAKFIGTNVTSDIFYIALRLPMILRVSLTDDTFNSAYVPIYGKIDDEQDRKAKYQFARNILFLLLIVLVPLIILVEIFMPNLLRILAPGIKESEDTILLIEISRIIFPYLIITIISSVFIGNLNTNNKFGLGAFLPTLISLALIFAILIFPFFEGEKVFFLSWSVILGGFLQLSLLCINVEKVFWKDFFSPEIRTKEIKNFFSLLGPAFASSSLIQINLLVSMILASYISGAMSYLYYAQRIYWLPYTLIGISIGSVLISNLSRSIRNSNISNAKVIQDQAYRFCVALILPITFFAIFTSDEIISVLFERGEFNSDSSTKTSFALKIFLLGLPAAALIKVLTPYFYSTNRPNIPFRATVISTIINIAITIVLFQFIGFIAIPVALSITAWLNLFILIFEHRKQYFFLLNKDLIKHSMKYIFLSLFLILVLYVCNFLLFESVSLETSMIFKTILVSLIWLFFIYNFDYRTFQLIKS